MQADFLDAQQRHWDDAEILFQAQRLANADHLYGVSAECGLKKLMIVFGMNVNSTTGSPVDRQDWKHANGLWARFESYRCGHVLGVGYVLSTPNSFDNWDVSQRYANQSNFDQQRTQAHQDGAKAVYELIKKAKLEGLV